MKRIKIVYIKGNPKYKEPIDHENVRYLVLQKVLEVFPSALVHIEDSESKDKSLPDADIYIGFSRGTRYFRKIPKATLKLSIGGISGGNILTLRNPLDFTHKGDLSEESLNAHFIVTAGMLKQLKKILVNYKITIDIKGVK